MTGKSINLNYSNITINQVIVELDMEYKYVKELPEPITCMVVYQEQVIVASANKVYKAKLPDGEILYQCTFAILEGNDL